MHCYREGKQLADWLANLGCELQEQSKLFTHSEVLQDPVGSAILTKEGKQREGDMLQSLNR